MRATILGFLAWIAFLVLDALTFGSAATGEMVIVQDGQPRATIVVAKDAAGPAKQKIKTAAEELQTYVQKISGAKLPIVDDGQNPSGTLVLLGRSRWSDGLGVAIPGGVTSGRREEGFVIACKGDRLLLAGNNDGPYHGTEYAVYDFLRSLGVRWFMPGEFGEIVPRMTTIRVPEQRVEKKPDFVMRNWWLHALPELAAQEARWKLRNKMNPEPMFAICGDSSVRAIVAPEPLRKEKPALLALNEDGTRNPYLPNLTNPEAARIAGGIIRDDLRKHPEANSYGFAPDDGMPARLQSRDAQAQSRLRYSGRSARRGRRGKHHRGMADVRQPRGGGSTQGVSASLYRHQRLRQSQPAARRREA